MTANVYYSDDADPTVIRGKKDLTLPPGAAQEFAIDLDLPALADSGPVEAELVLSCVRNGKAGWQNRGQRGISRPTGIHCQPACRSWPDGSTCHGRRCPVISTRRTCTGMRTHRPSA